MYACSLQGLSSTQLLLFNRFIQDGEEQEFSPQKKSSKTSGEAQVSTDEQHSTEPKIEVGNLVAANLQQYEEWLQIGKVLHVTRDNIEVQWYDGTYSEPWIPVKRKINGKYEYWTETIPIQETV